MWGCTPLHIPQATSTATFTLTPAGTKTAFPSFTPSPTSAIQLNEEQLQGVKIQLWHPYSGPIGETLDQLAKEFSHENQWQIAVESQGANGVDLLKERIETALEQGDFPNLVIIPLYQAIGWNQKQTILVDWAIYSEDVRWGLSASEQHLFVPNLWQANLVDNHRWGIPARRVAQLLLYNASWARELGYSAAPKTLTEFQEQACSIHPDEALANTLPAKGYLFTHDYPTILGWFMAFGAQIERSEPQGYHFKTPEVREAFIYLRNLYDRGCTLSSTDLDPIAVFAQRQALFVPIHSAQVQVLERAMQNTENHDVWTVLPFPTADGTGSAVLYGTDFIMLRSSEQEQLASWLFVRWLLESKNQKRWAQGTYSLPLRSDVVEELQNDAAIPAAYRATLAYLPLSRNEPSMASWDTVRWAVGDASRQLVAWYFALNQVPSLVELLDKTATELQSPQD